VQPIFIDSLCLGRKVRPVQDKFRISNLKRERRNRPPAQSDDFAACPNERSISTRSRGSTRRIIAERRRDRTGEGGVRERSARAGSPRGRSRALRLSSSRLEPRIEPDQVADLVYGSEYVGCARTHVMETHGMNCAHQPGDARSAHLHLIARSRRWFSSFRIDLFDDPFATPRCGSAGSVDDLPADCRHGRCLAGGLR
jgi:hypothetical protein